MASLSFVFPHRELKTQDLSDETLKCETVYAGSFLSPTEERARFCVWQHDAGYSGRDSIQTIVTFLATR